MNSILRSGRRRRVSGRWFRGGARRFSGGRRRKKGPSGDGALDLPQPQVVVAGQYYGGTFPWPSFVTGRRCPAPISFDCSELRLTAQWGIACFKPMYHVLRVTHGPEPEVIVEEMMRYVGCRDAQTAAVAELRRRLGLAVAILINSEGIPVRYPPPAVYPKPAQAEQFRQPWLRALLTGWM